MPSLRHLVAGVAVGAWLCAVTVYTNAWRQAAAMAPAAADHHLADGAPHAAGGSRGGSPQLRPPPPAPRAPAPFAACAGEGERCACVGDVRYGVASMGKWSAARPAAGSVLCSNAHFGDPLVGQMKTCECASTALSATRPFVLLFSGHLRSFQWQAPLQAKVFRDGAGWRGRPFYVFGHAWDKIEHTGKSWWTAGTGSGKALKVDVRKMLADPQLNPYLRELKATGGDFLVEPYDRGKMPRPKSMGCAGCDPPMLFGQHVQRFTWLKVQRLAEAYFRKRGIALPPDTLVVKSRPDGVVAFKLPVAQMQRELTANPKTVFSLRGPHEGGLGESGFVTSWSGFKQIAEGYLQLPLSVFTSKVAPEVNWFNELTLLHFAMRPNTLNVLLCRLNKDEYAIDRSSGSFHVGCFYHDTTTMNGGAWIPDTASLVNTVVTD